MTNSNPTIFITGSNRGIGLEFVKQYAKAGWRVIATCRRPKQAKDLQEAQQTYKDNIVIHQLDITDEVRIQDLAHELKNVSIDILLNNAGIYMDSKVTFGQLKSEDWQKVFSVNTIGPLLVAQAFINHVKQSKKKIIAAISSSMGSIALNTEGDAYYYRSSKSALNMAMKSLAIDLAPHKITCVVFHPGWVRTDMGGAGATLSPSVSITRLRNVLDNLSFSDSGRFIRHDGSEVPW